MCADISCSCTGVNGIQHAVAAIMARRAAGEEEIIGSDDFKIVLASGPQPSAWHVACFHGLILSCIRLQAPPAEHGAMFSRFPILNEIQDIDG